MMNMQKFMKIIVVKMKFGMLWIVIMMMIGIIEENFIIPSGTIHAILSGTSVCEIQQNSDVTYRIYDWDRVDDEGKKRELHKDKAIDVINKDTERKIIHCESIDDDNLYSTNKFSINSICYSIINGSVIALTD